MLRSKRIVRAVYGVFIILVTAFVVSSTDQIARPLFSAPENNQAAAERTSPKVGELCADALREQVAAIEKARIAATAEPSGAARARYASVRRASATSSDVANACTDDPNGKDALAALARLDRAAETRATKDAAELTTVRLAAQSFISGHPR